MRTLLGPIAVALVLACAGGPGPGSLTGPREDLAANRVDAAITKLEALRDRHPASPEVRDELGRAYYRKARAALDAKRIEEYETYLERALDEWVESASLDPASPSPHTMMGIVAAYQGDLNRALRSFNNARRLDPRHPVHYTNIAEVMIYRGEIVKARRFLDAARRYRAPPVILDLNETLAAWRQGDLVEARDNFFSAYTIGPEEVNTWNEAPVSDPIETFEDFTAYCCQDPACGPYMEKACHNLQLEVKRREVTEDLLRKELQLEMERRRRLREIYERRRDLEIEVEPPEED
jgi:tetratricopeptide (TPR) repeat protein